MNIALMLYLTLGQPQCERLSMPITSYNVTTAPADSVTAIVMMRNGWIVHHADGTKTRCICKDKTFELK